MDDRGETPYWYGEAFTEVIKRTNQEDKAVEYCKNHAQELGLSDTVSCLSIGPGKIHKYIALIVRWHREHIKLPWARND